MAKDVDAALHTLIEKHGGMTPKPQKTTSPTCTTTVAITATSTSSSRIITALARQEFPLSLPLPERALDTGSEDLVRMTVLAPDAPAYPDEPSLIPRALSKQASSTASTST